MLEPVAITIPTISSSVERMIPKLAVSPIAAKTVGIGLTISVTVSLPIVPPVLTGMSGLYLLDGLESM